MKRSADRILTTHVGSLVRTARIIEGMKAQTLNRPYDATQLAADIREGVAEVVRQQVEVGIDVPSNGEYSRAGFRTYINDRLSGLELRPLADDQESWAQIDIAEQALFPDFFKQYYSHYRYLWMWPEVNLDDVPNVPGNRGWSFHVTGRLAYKGQAAIQREMDDFRAALNGLNVADAFIPADVPTSRFGDEDILEFYSSEKAYYYAAADALREEYRAIVDGGFLVQVDLASLNIRGRAGARVSPEEASRLMEERVEIINHALLDIPEDKVRYHHCWGSQNQPHTTDMPLRAFVNVMLKINAQAYSVEAANPRHEHEWMVWRDVKLPDGKILIPGLVSHQTNVVEHPELIAWRLKNFASVVGRENVIAGTDCGFSQFWDHIRVHPSVQWAKLKSLADGAALASQELWAT